MKYLLTSEEMKRADEATAEYFMIPSLALMERAALGVADAICERFSAPLNILIACGNGNNGGDGYALGRILYERGFDVHFFMVKQSNHCTESNQRQKIILEKMGLCINTEIPNMTYDIIIDAMIGIGLKNTLSDEYTCAIRNLNTIEGFKIAIDIPSGIQSDTGILMPEAFKADLTITFGFMKKGHVMYPGKTYCGEVICKDIGITEKSFFNSWPKCQMLEQSDVKTLLPLRRDDSHKGTYKKVGIVAGSDKIAGAMLLSASAAMRSGVGYTKVLSSINNRELLLANCPECLFYNYADNDISDLLDCTCIAIGPGIGMDEKALNLLSQLFEIYNGNVVIDADALNLIANKRKLLEQLKDYANSHIVILTPHKKEFERLYGKVLPDDKTELYSAEENFAKELNIYLVCKDAATRIYLPNGKQYINSSGNDGMATAGSGDVLTGMIAGLLAQNADGEIASSLGVYLHGLCGDYIKHQTNVYALNASDLIDAMKYIFR